MSKKDNTVGLMSVGRDYMTSYGKRTLKGRSVPSLADGLKPVQRRVLWTMFTLGMRPNTKHRKAQRVIGSCLALYHPHGDVSVGDAMVKMVNAPEPYIDGQGNWGSLTDPNAAFRYIEARLSDYGWNNFFSDGYTDVIDFVLNYDDTDKEPVFLPSKTCNLLVNGTKGIAVGATTNIPSFTLASVNSLIDKALAAAQKGKKLTHKQVCDTLVFSNTYGGVAADTEANAEALRSLAETGYGAIEYVPVYEWNGNKRQLTITGFCASMQSGKLEQRVADFDEVDLIQNLTHATGEKFVITFRKSLDNTKLKAAQQKVIKAFSTRESYRISYLKESNQKEDADDSRTEMEFGSTGITQLLLDWLDIRRDLERRYIKSRIAKLEKVEERLRLLKLAQDKRDILDACRDDKDPKAFLIRKLKVTDEQADVLLSLMVKQLTRLFARDLISEMQANQKNIKDLKAQLKDIDGTLRLRLKEK